MRHLHPVSHRQEAELRGGAVPLMARTFRARPGRQPRRQACSLLRPRLRMRRRVHRVVPRMNRARGRCYPSPPTFAMGGFPRAACPHGDGCDKNDEEDGSYSP